MDRDGFGPLPTSSGRCRVLAPPAASLFLVEGEKKLKTIVFGIKRLAEPNHHIKTE